MRPEDPSVWQDEKGRFHMLFNANSGEGSLALNERETRAKTYTLSGLTYTLSGYLYIV
jgi:hypothetical protein